PPGPSSPGARSSRRPNSPAWARTSMGRSRSLRSTMSTLPSPGEPHAASRDSRTGRKYFTTAVLLKNTSSMGIVDDSCRRINRFEISRRLIQVFRGRMRMNQATRIGGWAAAVAVGVFLGAILLRRGEPTAPSSRPTGLAKAPAGPDRQATEELARANERIGALETQLRSLQQKVESRGVDKEALLKELKEAALREADAAGDGFEEKDAL